MTLEELETRSYTPYSGQPAAVILESRSGKLYPGVRIENISFPLTISAMQCAVVICTSEGEQPAKVYRRTPPSTDGETDFWERELDLEYSVEPDFDKELDGIVTSHDDISHCLQRLLGRSHSPYSNFPVSTILETSGGLVSGVNIEFSAWESGLCAERTAIAKAIAGGIDLSSIKALHLHTRHGEYSSPCGACRQVIIEHLPQIPVFIHHSDGSLSRHFSSDLLPYSFKSDFLKKNLQHTKNQ
ncbi:cytidine deaminase [Halalkalibaculum sp. DA3122]|uniref:cytidine deaminase n=1 Tax=Halalkalibaculum sp. DA3122 TaxID=3373607 RepID=UPI003754EC91